MKNIAETAFEQAKIVVPVQEVFDDGDSKTFAIPHGFETFVVDSNKERPSRKKGSKSFTSAKSFCSYVNKHKSEDETVIIADEKESKVKAIINDDGAENAAWSDFSALLKIEHSTQWKEWFSNSHIERGHGLFEQSEFAEFVEKNRSDFICGKFEVGGDEVENITPGELNAMIRDLKITVSEKISSRVDKQSGAVNFAYENEEDGKNEFKIPEQIYIVIPVYRSADLFRVKIRLMYRNNGGVVKFFYIIDKIDDLKTQAFDRICERIENGKHDGARTNEIDVVVPGKDDFEGTEIEVYQGII